MTKVVAIVEDNPITGVKYGTVELHETPIEIKRAHDTFKKRNVHTPPKFVVKEQKRNNYD